MVNSHIWVIRSPPQWMPFLLLILAWGCSPEAPKDTALDQLRRSGELIVLTRNSPTTYYEGREELEGFEYELAQAFAQSLGLVAKFRVLDNTSDILEAINRNEGHIAAAGLTRTAVRQARYHFGPDVMPVRQKVICGRDKALPKNLKDLSRLSLSVVADSSYEERLRALRTENPDLTWTATRELETEQLMDRVWRGDLDCTIADSNIVDINRRYYPELKVAFSISNGESVAWVAAPAYTALVQEMENWFAGLEQQWLVEQLQEKYFGYVPHFDYVDIKVFQRRIEQRLPQYIPVFRQAEQDNDIPWRLLAAQAYQESHWDTMARSPTGVRGIMMLTQRTANQLGIFDRLDPGASIMGGASYLAQILARLPDSLTEPDRTWVALAAYNVGYGHISDARLLAKKQGLNPDSWRHLSQVLPFLAQKKYYQDLPHGYARGREPVRYVKRIRNFRDLLERYYPNDIPTVQAEP